MIEVIVFVAALWAAYKIWKKASFWWYRHFLDQYGRKRLIEQDTYRGYPPDWQIRKQIIYNRDAFQCQQCKRVFQCVFRPTWDWDTALLGGIKVMISRGYLCHGAHVHHINPISKGGAHELSNLILLCDDCHSKMEGHETLRIKMKLRQFWRYRPQGGRLKQARKIHTCFICEICISSGQYYFGGSYGSVLCSVCYHKYVLRRNP